MQKISPFDLKANPFDLINNHWAMVTTRRGDKINTMAASWGGVGIMWGKPAAYVFIRPQRFTHEQLEGSELFSLCFLPEEYRREMAGVYTTSVSEGTLDEAPMAYKSLEDIIDVIHETTDIIDIMKPIYNFKAE